MLGHQIGPLKVIVALTAIQTSMSAIQLLATVALAQTSKAPPLHSRFILAIHFDIKMSCKGLDYTLNITSSAVDSGLRMPM